MGFPGFEVTKGSLFIVIPLAAQVGLAGLFEVTKVLLFKVIPLFLFGVDAGEIVQLFWDVPIFYKPCGWQEGFRHDPKPQCGFIVSGYEPTSSRPVSNNVL